MSAEALTVLPSAPAPRAATSLYELVERHRAVLVRLDEAEGEIDGAIAAELDALASSLEERVEACKAVYQSLHEEAEACDRMARPYQDRAKRKRAQADTIKARLKLALEECGRSKVETPTATAALQKNPPSVELTVPVHELEQHVPEQYLERSVKLRAAETKAALQSGATFTWARFAPTTHHLRFR